MPTNKLNYIADGIGIDRCVSSVQYYTINQILQPSVHNDDVVIYMMSIYDLK